MTIFETIYNRQTIRKYTMEEYGQEIINSIKKYMDQVTALNPEISTSMEIVSYKEKKDYFHGLLHKAPYYLAFYSEKKEGDYINAGYMLEQMVLYLTLKGIGTCYLSGVKGKDFRINNKRLLILVAFGKTDQKIFRNEKEANRLPLDKLCVFKEDVNRSFITMLEAARLAPSSFNSQPWRFVVYNKRIHMFCKKNRIGLPLLKSFSQIDLGIALAHISIAAEDLWVDIQIKHLDNIASMPMVNNEYIASITLIS